MIAEGLNGLGGVDPHKAVKNYINAAGKGVLKVALAPDKLTVARQMHANHQHTMEAIAEVVGVSRATLYRHLALLRIIHEYGCLTQACHVGPTPAKTTGPRKKSTKKP